MPIAATRRLLLNQVFIEILPLRKRTSLICVIGRAGCRTLHLPSVVRGGRMAFGFDDDCPLAREPHADGGAEPERPVCSARRVVRDSSRDPPGGRVDAVAHIAPDVHRVHDRSRRMLPPGSAASAVPAGSSRTFSGLTTSVTAAPEPSGDAALPPRRSPEPTATSTNPFSREAARVPARKLDSPMKRATNLDVGRS